MRCAFWIAVPLALMGQISKPPEFQEKGAFQKSDAAGRVDGTSHIAAERAETNERLIGLLRKDPAYAEGLRLIENQMLREAADRFRKDRRQPGAAVALFLLGDVEASAAILHALTPSLEVLPFLGETVGAAPAWSSRFLARIEAVAKANPLNADAAFYLARALTLQMPAQSVAALSHLRRSADLDSKGSRALVELGRQHSDLNDRSAAIATFEEALRRDPAVKVAHYRLAQLYRAAGNLEKSRQHLLLFQAR